MGASRCLLCTKKLGRGQRKYDPWVSSTIVVLEVSLVRWFVHPLEEEEVTAAAAHSLVDRDELRVDRPLACLCDFGLGERNLALPLNPLDLETAAAESVDGVQTLVLSLRGDGGDPPPPPALPPPPPLPRRRPQSISLSLFLKSLPTQQ